VATAPPAIPEELMRCNGAPSLGAPVLCTHRVIVYIDSSPEQVATDAQVNYTMVANADLAKFPECS
jgi:hypothetical protein